MTTQQHTREQDETLATLDRLRAQIEHAERNEHEWLASLARRKLREAAGRPLMKNTNERYF